MISKEVKVVGKVQGVFFRASTKEQAERLGLNGWVKNQHDGTVLIQVTGDSNRIHKFLDWCKKGPILSRVDEVQVSHCSETHTGGFSITS